MIDNQLLNIVIIVFASFGLVIFMFMVYGSIADYIISHKPKGDKLKKARERFSKKEDKKRKRKLNKQIKSEIKYVTQRYIEDYGWATISNTSEIVDAVFKLLDDNGIEYSTDYDEDEPSVTIYFDKKE